MSILPVGGKQAACEAWSRDISHRGIFFYSDVPFSPGQKVEVRFSLAPASDFTIDIPVLGRGTVVRSETAGKRFGAGVALDVLQML